MDEIVKDMEEDAEVSNFSDQNTIIQAILKVIAAEELGKWRLVSKFCNKLAIQQMHIKEVAVTLRDSQEVDGFVKTMTVRFQPIPFRSFSLALGSINLDDIERFIQTVGINEVERFKFYELLPDLDPYELLFFPHDIQSAFRENGIQEKIIRLLGVTGNTLVELQINADADIPLTTHEMTLIPTQFPKLSKIVVDYVCVFADEPNDVVSLVIARTPNLEQLHLKVWDGPNSRFNSKIPGYLYDTPRPHFPELTLITELTNDDRATVDSLVTHAYMGFKHLVICFIQDENDIPFWQGVKPLVALQSNLETLFLQSFSRPGIFERPLQLPPLKKLRSLLISWLYKEDSSPIESITEGQFPVLEEVSLFGPYSFNYGWIQGVTITTLKKLVIWDYQGPAMEETWHLNFPQLKILEVEVSFEGLSFLKYAFTHLTGLEVLEVGSSLSSSALGVNVDLWELYTGTTDVNIKDQVLNFFENEQEVTPLLSPDAIGTVPGGMHLIYAIPSLANFKNLQELKVWTRTELEIAALVYMSRPGGLPALVKLILGYRPLHLDWGDESSDQETLLGEPSEISTIDFRHENLPSEQSVLTTVTEENEDFAAQLSEVVQIFEETEDEDEDHDQVDDWGDDENDDTAMRINLGLGLPHSVMPIQVSSSESGINPAYISILENYHKQLIILMT